MTTLERINQLKDIRGWSNYKLAKEANIPQGSLNNLFRLNNQPTIPTLEAICNAFGISMSQFFANEEEAFFLTEEQKELIDTWNCLDENQKVLSRDIMLSMLPYKIDEDEERRIAEASIRRVRRVQQQSSAARVSTRFRNSDKM